MSLKKIIDNTGYEEKKDRGRKTMRQIRQNSCFISLLLSLLLSFGAKTVSAVEQLSTAQGPVVLAADPWCPYNCVPGTDLPGFGVEIARLAFARLGRSLTYVTRPWSRALEEVRHGHIDGVIGASALEGRGLVYPRQPIGYSVDFLLKRKGYSYEWSGVSSLETHRLGLVQDYEYSTTLANYIASHRSNTQKILFSTGRNPLENNIKRLLKERIDLVVGDHAVLSHAVLQMGLEDKVDFIGGFDDPLPVYIAFGQNHPQQALYRRIFDETVEDLHDSGEFVKILAKYGIKDWKCQHCYGGKRLASRYKFAAYTW